MAVGASPPPAGPAGLLAPSEGERPDLGAKQRAVQASEGVPVGVGDFPEHSSYVA
jgi:hypothetical protein